MTEQKRIVISTFGSFGDIHPYMAIALELQRRGHDPVIATMEFYREKIEGAGLGFAPARPNIPPPHDQDQDLIDRIMEPKSGPRFLMEQVVFPAVRDCYADLLKAVARADLLVTHPAAPAGPMVARKTGIPWVSTVLAPLSFFSAYDPPVPPYWPWIGKLRVLGPGFMKWFLNTMKGAYKAEAVTEFREEIGLSDSGNPMFEGQHSPARVLSLFSSVFANAQPDWPPQTRITGFCFYDGQHEAPMSAELERFLDSGPPPIVFTLGSSAVWVAGDFFRQSIVATEQLGKRAVIIIGDHRNKPGSLSENIFPVDYAPYQKLLPRASCIVHHGGVGTTSQALRAGAPTLIVPFAFDQMDNADHARRLGTSRTLYRRGYVASRVAKELEKLLIDPSYARNANHVGQQLRRENGAASASEYIEEILGTRADREEPAYASGN